ncbi:hypothetical protein STSP_73780 [Streptomyces jeddahensis]|uniref:Uncharacterized protein n=1 Tax=Streptomyces jeddahensis TaxID=1716141 RepID=A0A177HG96_9ACTN|nr:hypothetical protein STSP_73780 [Streptomyces jeddahensis]
MSPPIGGSCPAVWLELPSDWLPGLWGALGSSRHGPDGMNEVEAERA